MKKISNSKNIIITSLVIFVIIITCINLFPNAVSSSTKAIAVKKISDTILADGVVDSANTAILHFQVGGKLAYLPFKEGDPVYAGQTIAQLDTYALQRQLTIALNNYRSTRNTFDQTKDNAENGVAVGQQRYAIEKTSLSGLTNPGELDIVNNIIKRIADQNQAALDNSVANVELTSYALQLSSLTSPIDGVITRLDVSTSNVNITPSTSFVVADPNNLVFNANVSESMINYIDVGNKAVIKITNGEQISGTVSKIYPQRITLPIGENIYKVEITSNNFTKVSKMGQSGSVQIASNLTSESMIVPSWTVLGKKYIWVVDDNKFIMKTVKVGKILGNETEIIDGLKQTDKVIFDPKSITNRNYKLL